MNKIVSLKKLLGIVGTFPRDKKLIMCHGVFDIVHPGHIRHLSFAKQKGDFLVVSITKDKFIEKGTYRPHIPEDLRAKNLTYFEFVDFIIIDDNPTPIKNISILKPDYFAKGYEYSQIGKNTINYKTVEEAKTIESYGGKIIFTPGDVVYSSSKILSEEKPKLKNEKLQIIFEQQNINFDSLKQALKKIKNIKIHIVGDTIIDSLSRCSMLGGQGKTPTMSVKFERKDDFIGGAGIVAKHLKSAGADVSFTTVVGDDRYADMLKDEFNNKIELNLIKDSSRPTTNKNAFIVGDYRLIKVDTLDNRTINDQIASKIQEKIKNIKTDCVIFSDFRHGIFNKHTIPFFIKSIPQKIFKIADSQVASRWGNILDFQNFDMITPNEKEARFSLADQDSNIGSLATELIEKSKTKHLILKLGDKGILFNNEKFSDDKFFFLDSFVDNNIDAVGAGDALLAYASLVLIKTKNIAISSILGSIAAACECEKDGNIPISPNDILKKIIRLQNEYYLNK